MILRKRLLAYAQAEFNWEDFRGNFGVRYVKTEQTVTSTDRVILFLDDVDDKLFEQTGDVSQSTTAGNVRSLDFEQPITRVSEDEQFLPSFNLVWDVTDDIILRAAVAKTMSRPELNDLGAQEDLRFVSQEWADDRAEYRNNPVDQGWSASGGNKALKPYESVQSDISLEYYYGEGSGAGIALFNKEVDNFVVPLLITDKRTTEGYTHPDTGAVIVPAGEITVTPYNTVANGSDATSRGVEVYLQHNFTNGFGINTNYTYNDTNKANVSVKGESVGESELIGSSKNQFNFSAYYENDLFSVRASYNRRGKRSLGLHDGLNVYAEPYQQVDINASYSITEDLTLTASVINLTEEESRTYYGGDTEDRLRTSSYSGRRAYAGLSYRF